MTDYKIQNKLGVGEILICNKDTKGKFESLKHFKGKLILTIGGGCDKIYIVEEKDRISNDVKSIQSRGIPSLLNTQQFPDDFKNYNKEKPQENEEGRHSLNESRTDKDFKTDRDRRDSMNDEPSNRSTALKLLKKGINSVGRELELEEDAPYKDMGSIKSNYNEFDSKMEHELNQEDNLGGHEHNLQGSDSNQSLRQGSEVRNEQGINQLNQLSQINQNHNQNHHDFDTQINEMNQKNIQSKPFSANTDGMTKYSGGSQEDFLKSQLGFKDSQIVQIVKGKYHLLKLTIDGKVWGCGSAYFGVVGLGGSGHSDKPYPIPNLTKLKICQIACGMFHSLALSKGGDLYVWGMGFEGQLGLSSPFKIATSPRYLNFFYKKPVKFITCGHNYSLCITSDNKLWGWGENKLGQLGLGKTQIVDKPTEIIILDLPGNQEKCVKSDNLINGTLDREYSGEPLRACYASAGFAHSAVVTEEGFILTFGLNIYGQLGLGNTKSTFEPRLIEKDENGENLGKIIKSGCNTSGTFMITDKGDLYTCGSGEIGHGDKDNGVITLPKQIVGNRIYSEIFCNDSSVVVFCPLKIFSVSPNCGPSNGNTILSIIGSAFKDFSKLSVRFLWSGIQHDMKATFDKNSGTIFVKTPVFSNFIPNMEYPCHCKIQITFDGVYFTEYAEPFLIYNNLTKTTGIVPKCGPIGGGTNLQININLDNIPTKYLFSLTVGFQAKQSKDDGGIFGRLKRKKKQNQAGQEVDDSRSQGQDDRSVFNTNQMNSIKDTKEVSHTNNPLDISPGDTALERANWYCSFGSYENGVITCNIPKIENFIQNQVEYNVDVSINGQQFSGFPMIYRFYDIKFQKVEPNISNVEGGLIMKIFAAGLFDSLVKRAKITSEPFIGERWVDLQWDRVDKALVLISQPLIWITNNEEILKNIQPSKLFEEYDFNIEITMNNLDLIKCGNYKYFDPKIWRVSFCVFPDTCITLQDRFLHITQQTPLTIEEKTCLELCPPPTDKKQHDEMKKIFTDEDDMIAKVAKRPYNALYLYGEYFPQNSVMKVRFRNELAEYEFPSVWKNKNKVCCLFSDMPKLPPGQHEYEIDVTFNGQQYVKTGLKFLYLQPESKMTPEEIIKMDIDEMTKDPKKKGKGSGKKK